MAVLTKWTLAATIGMSLVSAAHAATLDSSLLPTVRAATFEVVAAKADESKIVYEKPLPLDQLPFQERNDHYRSMGTAFAIGDGRFVTAMHVFMEGVDSLQGPLQLRDEQGHVFTIDKVVRFSVQEDFVVFTLDHAPAVKPLEIERTPSVNESVFAVGNALGTGVVLRDGLYTSDTPEEMEGRWKWIRYSAPTSPGNSGGPLIDDKGKVIGVVLRKSPGENLNYALPIGLVMDASDKLANIDERRHFTAPYSADAYNVRIREVIPVPLSVSAFNTRMARLTNDSEAQSERQWLEKHAATLFPLGQGSHDLLTRTPWTDSFPGLVTEGSSGTWERTDERRQRVPIADKGYVEEGLVAGTVVWHIHSALDRPGMEKGGHAVFDPILSLGHVTRTVGEDKIKIRSLGDPASTETFTDRQGRSWHLDKYPFVILDALVLVASTPTPDGAVGMLRVVRARESGNVGIQLRMMADLEDIAYHGTLAQWQSFLSNGDLPTVLRGASVHGDATGVSIDMDGLAARWPATVVPVNERTEVGVLPGWTVEDGKPALHVRRLALKQPDSPEASVVLNRYERYFDDSAQEAISFWHDLMAHAHPRDGQPYSRDDVRIIAAVYDPVNPDAAHHAYALDYTVRGTATDDELRKRFADIARGTKVPDTKPLAPAH